MTASRSPVRVGVVGFGFGQHHVRTLVHMPDVQLVAVADQQRFDDVREAGQRYGFVPYEDAGEMITKADLDAVTLCVPPRYREGLIRAAVDAELAMLIEKPWAATSDQARELAAIARESSRPVMPAFSFRFHPAIARLRELIGDVLGPPRMLMCQYVFGWLPPSDHWAWDPANGNGFLNENACHLFDAVCSIMGRPIRVFAEGGWFCARPMEDSAAIAMRFADGGIATLACGGIGAASIADFPRISVWTQAGQAELLGRDHVWQSLQWALHGDEVVRQFTASPEQLGQTRYTHAMQHFIDAVRSGSPPPATTDEAVLTVDVAMAVVRSAREGRPVDIGAESKPDTEGSPCG